MLPLNVTVSYIFGRFSYYLRWVCVTVRVRHYITHNLISGIFLVIFQLSCCLTKLLVPNDSVICRGRHGRDHMVVGFTTTYSISAYNHWSCEFESRLWRGVLDTTLCDKVCQWLVASQWFSLDNPVSSTTKTHHHDITEILMKVVLNTITLDFQLI